MTEENQGLSRRTLVKGAAWSVPVVIAAVAAPARAASLPPGTDVEIIGACDNHYDLSVLRSIVGPVLLGTVQLALGALGLRPNAQRTFTINALDGDIPAGTQFQLTYPAGLINLTLLQTLLQTQALGVLSANSTNTIFELTADLPEGSQIIIDLFSTIINIGAASSITLALLDTDQPPNPGTEGADSAVVFTALAVAVNLGALGIPLVSGSLAVQLCGA